MKVGNQIPTTLAGILGRCRMQSTNTKTPVILSNFSSKPMKASQQSFPKVLAYLPARSSTRHTYCYVTAFQDFAGTVMTPQSYYLFVGVRWL
jgi:hypothetical protein